MPGHDYAQGGAYFVTICVEGQAMLFGEIDGATMRPNDCGRMIEATWYETVSRCNSVESGAFQLMPNHVHGLVIIHGIIVGPPATSLPDFVGAFKSTTTWLYSRAVRDGRWPAYDRRLWQRDYYEHLVRNDRSRERILRYIAANPSRWAFDRENPRSIRPTDL